SRDMGSVHLEQADELLRDGITSASTDFPMEYGMRIQYGKVEFFKKAKTEKNSFEYEININKEGKIQISELNAEIGVKILSRQDWVSWRKKEKFGSNNEICSLSLDKLRTSEAAPILRTRKSGDYIVPFGMSGRKKLQDFFVDAKIDKMERDRIPIVSIGAEVIWIVGSRISENFKVEDVTEQIIVLEYCTKT
ncbi:MAG: tilS, partial [Bacillota bacterium]|nr:tilS [Bacillota bacterium]